MGIRLAAWLLGAVVFVAVPGQSVSAQAGTPLPTVRTPGTITGEVVDSAGVPIPGATVRFINDSLYATRSGYFRFGVVMANRGWLVATYPGYYPAEVQLDLPSGWDMTVKVILVPDGSAVAAVDEADASQAAGRSENMLSGRVVGPSGEPLRDVQIAVGGASRSAVTRTDGRYAFLDFPRGTFYVTFRRMGYTPVQRTITVDSRGNFNLSVTMVPLAEELAPVLVQGLSGWGRRSIVLAELDERMIRRASVTSAIVSTSQLERARRLPLDQALTFTGAGRFQRDQMSRFDRERYARRFRLDRDADRQSFDSELQCVLINGERPVRAPLTMYTADHVRMVEVYENGADLTHTVANRMSAIRECRVEDGWHPVYFVVWFK